MPDKKPVSAERTVVPDGEKVKTARKECGLSVVDLAAKATVSKSAVEAASRGDPIYASSLRRIADALGVKPKSLLPGDSGEMEILLRLTFNGVDKAVIEAKAETILNVLTQAMTLLTTPDIEAIEDGSVILVLRMHAVDAAYLVESFPTFSEQIANYCDSIVGDEADAEKYPAIGWTDAERMGATSAWPSIASLKQDVRDARTALTSVSEIRISL